MQSSNPAFRRMDGFNGRTPQGNATYPGNGQSYAGYGDPSTWQTGATGTAVAGRSMDPAGYAAPAGSGAKMTIDSAVQKTAITLGLLVLTAAATWVLTPGPDASGLWAQSDLNLLYTLSLVGAFVGFGLAMVNSFKRVVSPALVLAYAAVEGVFVGAMSKTFQLAFGGGVVTGAVLGTIAAVAGTLAAYKFFNITVTPKFRKWVVGAMIGFVAVSLLDFVLHFFKADFGFNGFGTLGLITSVIGLGIGVFMLILDFDFVERGVAAGLDERESWRAAFGLTVTIVWIYIELLRILAILRGD